MNSTFSRALVGFIVLTLAVSGMAYVALWGIEAYAGNTWWVAGLVILLALGAEICIYMTTLHDPIYDWIREPKREAERKELEAERKEREARQRQLDADREARKIEAGS